jgi:hypothetical protein
MKEAVTEWGTTVYILVSQVKSVRLDRLYMCSFKKKLRLYSLKKEIMITCPFQFDIFSVHLVLAPFADTGNNINSGKTNNNLC